MSSASTAVWIFFFVFLALPWHPPPSRVRVPPCWPRRASRVTTACVKIRMDDQLVSCHNLLNIAPQVPLALRSQRTGASIHALRPYHSTIPLGASSAPAMLYFPYMKETDFGSASTASKSILRPSPKRLMCWPEPPSGVSRSAPFHQSPLRARQCASRNDRSTHRGFFTPHG